MSSNPEIMHMTQSDSVTTPLSETFLGQSNSKELAQDDMLAAQVGTSQYGLNDNA